MARSDSRADGYQKQSAGVYTGSLLLSFLALTAACVFLYLKLKTYDDPKNGLFHLPALKVPSNDLPPPPPARPEPA